VCARIRRDTVLTLRPRLAITVRPMGKREAVLSWECHESVTDLITSIAALVGPPVRLTARRSPVLSAVTPGPGRCKRQ
jgi:hypothetical protein